MRYIAFILFFFITFTYAQQFKKVDFLLMNGTVELSSNSKKVKGNINYQFKVLETIDTVAIDAVNMTINKVFINKREVQFKNTSKQLLLFEGFKMGNNTIDISYSVTPKKAIYFMGEGENLQIWTQGQGKETSNWLPSFDDANEKVIFNLNVIFDKNFTVISNGKAGKNENNNTFSFFMKKPMSSYLLMLAIGNFDKKVLYSKSGIPLELYYKPNDKDKVETTYKYAEKIFDYFEEEIGYSYPWEIYKQVPVEDFLYGGMENTSATIFAQDFIVDEIEFNDTNYINVNAHELAHQWFGDLVTAQTGEHHWLQEGFATYYALLAEKEIFGANHFYKKLYDYTTEISHASKTDTIPILNKKASSLTFYKKGALALHVLREAVGHINFKKAVLAYLKKHAFSNVTTNDFLLEIKKVSNYNVEEFKKRWLESSNFEIEEVVSLLSKNNFIKELLNLQNNSNLSFEEKKVIFKEILLSDSFYPLKQELVYQLADVSFEDKKELIEIALQTQDVQVRKAVAQTVDNFPESFLNKFETLLEDKSYITKELAFKTIWNGYPEKRSALLDKTKNWLASNDFSFRIQWLALAISVYEMENRENKEFYEELINYSTSQFNSRIRQNALEVLLKIKPEKEMVLKSLINATTHHKWQFVKFANENLRILIKDNKYKQLFINLLPQVNEKEKSNLEKLLQE